MRFIFLTVSLLLLTACESLSYYSQLAQGQWNIVWQRRAIEQLVADGASDKTLRTRLLTVQSIRQFSIDHLSLPDNRSYRYYTDLKRRYVLWNVFAAEEFSTQAKDWCFPIAGCVSYRGYFSEQAARDYARLLSEQGYDSYIGGVAAYSSLGWFADPVLNTFLYRDDVHLAALIFHELAHQQLYVPGDTAFNESFATAVEIFALKKWLLHRERNIDPLPESSTAGELTERYLRELAIRDDFVELILSLRAQLQRLYNEDRTKTEMRREKQQIIQELIVSDYPLFKRRWDGYSKYDTWITGDALNNAKLNTIASYNQWLPAFQTLLRRCDSEMTCFFEEAAKLAELKKEFRLLTLKKYGSM